jgi:predicted nucleic acid-binding protein
MSLPRLYVETTIPSYLTARRSPLARIATDQQTTQDWWEAQRSGYELFVSETVLDEAAIGDAAFAAKRLAVLDVLPRLALTPEAAALATRLLTTEIIPAKAAPDALHLAIAAAHGMDFLLTWNCRHIHNLKIERRIQAVCRAFGLECPIICTPAELMEN